MKKLILFIFILLNSACFAQPDIDCYSQQKLDSIVNIYKDSINVLIAEKYTLIANYSDSITAMNHTIEGLCVVNEILRNDTATSSVVLDSITYQIAFSNEENVIDVTNSNNLIRVQLMNDKIKIWIRRENELIPFMDLGILNIFAFIK